MYVTVCTWRNVLQTLAVPLLSIFTLAYVTRGVPYVRGSTSSRRVWRHERSRAKIAEQGRTSTSEPTNWQNRESVTCKLLVMCIMWAYYMIHTLWVADNGILMLSITLVAFGNVFAETDICSHYYLLVHLNHWRLRKSDITFYYYNDWVVIL